MGAARSIGTLTVLNIAGAVISVANSVVVAQFFGTGREVEIYFAASTLQTLILSLTQSGQIGEIFLPVYHRLRQASGVKVAQQAFSAILNWMLLFVFALALAMWLSASFFLRMLVPGFGADDQASGVIMFRWILPLLCIQVVFSLVQTLANAEKWFGRPESVAVGARLCIVISILLLAPSMGIWAMVVSMWISQSFQFLGYVWMLYRMGYRYSFVFSGREFSAWSIFRKMAVTFLYVGSTQIYQFGFNAGVSLLPQGTYAVFKYVQQLYEKTMVVLAVPISTVFFTHFSEALAKGSLKVKLLAQRALTLCLGVSVLTITAVMAAGEPLLNALWGGKHFGTENLALAVKFLKLFYLLLSLWVGLNLITRKILMTLGFVRQVYLSGVLVQILSAICAWLLIRFFGIAGAMSVIFINAAAMTLAWMFVLWIYKRDMLVYYPIGHLLKWSAAGLAGILVGYGVNFFIKQTVLVGNRFGQLLCACVLAGTSVMVTLIIAWLLNIYEVREGTRLISKKLPFLTVRQP
ncbi:MAG: lipid II flippase MurJ [Sedimentisphaerales bacterium]